MIKKNYKGRCERKQLSKCHGICRLYNKIQVAYSIWLYEYNIKTNIQIALHEE